MVRRESFEEQTSFLFHRLVELQTIIQKVEQLQGR
jgi:hypothetical protein